MKHTEAYIKKYGKEVEAEIRNRLLSAGKLASGKLLKSIRFMFRKSVENLEVEFRMADYGKFVDKGVSGAGIPNGFKGKKKRVIKNRPYSFTTKMPPESSIRSWLRIQGLPKEASFPIRRSIFIFGIEPTNFFTIPTTRRQKQFIEKLDEAIAKDIDEQIGDFL